MQEQERKQKLLGHHFCCLQKQIHFFKLNLSVSLHLNHLTHCQSFDSQPKGGFHWNNGHFLNQKITFFFCASLNHNFKLQGVFFFVNIFLCFFGSVLPLESAQIFQEMSNSISSFVFLSSSLSSSVICFLFKQNWLVNAETAIENFWFTCQLKISFNSSQ